MKEAIDKKNRFSLHNNESTEDNVTFDYDLTGFAEAFNKKNEKRLKFNECLTWVPVELDKKNLVEMRGKKPPYGDFNISNKPNEFSV